MVTDAPRDLRSLAMEEALPPEQLGMLAQARSLPLLLGSLGHAVAGALTHFDPATMAEGDGFVSNDPWSGGTHLPDLLLMRPVLVADGLGSRTYGATAGMMSIPTLLSSAAAPLLGALLLAAGGTGLLIGAALVLAVVALGLALWTGPRRG